VASPHHIAVRWEFSLFGFCLSFAKTKCAKLAIANPPSEGGERRSCYGCYYGFNQKSASAKNFKNLFA
jgi:hypothetical protein